MAMCDDCKKIELGKRGANSHPGLKAMGEPIRFSPGIGQAKASRAHHQCMVCGTDWTYTDDRNDDHLGWSLGWAG